VDKMTTWRKVLIGLAIVVALLVPAVAVYAVVDSQGGHGGTAGHPASGMMTGDMDTMHGQMSGMPGHMSGGHMSGGHMSGGHMGDGHMDGGHMDGKSGGGMGGAMSGHPDGGMSGPMGGIHPTGSTTGT
jgi:hypothetical protein